MSRPKVLISDALSPAAVQIFKDRGIEVDFQPNLGKDKEKLAVVEADWQARMESLDERWKELSHISNLMVPPMPPRSGLNLSKRSQALQMLRRGETPRDISSALSIPLGEAELLIKVQRIAVSGLSASV